VEIGNVEFLFRKRPSNEVAHHLVTVYQKDAFHETPWEGGERAGALRRCKISKSVSRGLHPVIGKGHAMSQHIVIAKVMRVGRGFTGISVPLFAPTGNERKPDMKAPI
jgi:hypothetical protein